MNDFVAVVMATYNPPTEWFVELLQSINSQEYPHIHLHVIDDCSTTITLNDIDRYLKTYITHFAYTLSQNPSNMGSTKTFEKLTEMVADPFIAYCDQDDIWESFKLTDSIKLIKKANAALVCSDVKIIDKKGTILCESITQIRKRHIFPTAPDNTNHLLFRNYVIGCTILMKTDIAQMAVPFVDGMVHDHWLALFARSKATIAVFPKPLMRYRIHDHNQTNILTGVYTKSDYFNARIITYLKQLHLLSQRIHFADNTLEDALKWAQARVDYFQGDLRAGFRIWKYRKLNITTSYFEICMKFMPNPIFKWVLKKIKNSEL